MCLSGPRTNSPLILPVKTNQKFFGMIYKKPHLKQEKNNTKIILASFGIYINQSVRTVANGE